MEESPPTSIFGHKHERLKRDEMSHTVLQYNSGGSRESNGKEWEAKIMDRVSKMTISTANNNGVAATTPDRSHEIMTAEEISTPLAAEVSFTAEDLEPPISSNRDDSNSTLLVVDNYDLSRKTSPLRRRNHKRDFAYDNVASPPCSNALRSFPKMTDAETPQVSNSYQSHRRKKSRTWSSTCRTPPSIHRPPQQPCFSPFRLSPFRVQNEQDDDEPHKTTQLEKYQQQVLRQFSFDHNCPFPANEVSNSSDDSVCTLTHTSQESSTTTSPIVWKAGDAAAADSSSLNIVWLQPDSSCSPSQHNWIRRKHHKKRFLRMRFATSSSSFDKDDSYTPKSPPRRNYVRRRSPVAAMQRQQQQQQLQQSYVQQTNKKSSTPHCTPTTMMMGQDVITAAPSFSFSDTKKIEKKSSSIPQVPFFPLLSPISPTTTNTPFDNIHGKDVKKEENNSFLHESQDMCRTLPDL